MSTIVEINLDNEKKRKVDKVDKADTEEILQTIKKIKKHLNNIEEEEEEKEECQGICVILCLCLFGCGLIAASVCYYVYGITFLIENKDENDECNSDIWKYVLTSIVISAIVSPALSNIKTEDNIFVLLLISSIAILLLFGVGVWGVVLCASEKCDELIDTNLFKFAYYLSIVQLSISSMIMFCLFCFGIITIINQPNEADVEITKHNEENNEENNDKEIV